MGVGGGMGAPVNAVPIRRTTHCFHVMTANETKESVFGYRKIPCLSLGSIPVPLALETSALTTEVPRFLRSVFACVALCTE